MDALHVMINGTPRALGAIAPHENALDFLRGCGLTGAKEGCAEGECGACSVLVARPAVGADGEDAGTEWTAINACLIPAAALDGQEVVTAEGLGAPGALHPVQQEMAVRGGSQCGYCTPGFVCSMAAEFYREGRCAAGGPATSPVDPTGNGHAVPPGREGDERTDAGHERGPNGFDLHALSGNLCRCTGYRPIRDAAYALGEPVADDPLAARRAEPAPAAAHTRLAGRGGDFVRPADLTEALGLLAERPDAQLVAGSTDWGVEVNLRGARPALVLAVDRLPELRELNWSEDAVEIGAALSLSEVERRLAGRVPLLDQLFPQFASRLIRNGATIGGNLGTGSPIGDTPPALLALEATVVLASREGRREVVLADYFTGYRRSVRAGDELIVAVRIPLPLAPVTAFHKVSKRRFDDISSVAVAHALTIEDGVVKRARIGLGGVAATPLRALATEAALEGRPWSEDVVREAAATMRGEGTPMDDHRASSAYRSAMLATSLLRLFAEHPPSRAAERREVTA
ncbi:xanthine dehydrogenase small subunit [Knoellia sp. p5-6-4]|uniref:xanthine dehydrogenase small subunit n=1 Tax=unclassified Knoellia TaxID=2618719 RepID=UPI0023D98797|nr:FAD binding domain-containing protein [Knoellia sp. p5-6-4]MDF2144724.1 FAD binding domain-containing protein [Knoellia sp. p5-6-4]